MYSHVKHHIYFFLIVFISSKRFILQVETFKMAANFSHWTIEVIYHFPHKCESF